MRYEPNDCNNEDRLTEHIERCQKFLKLRGNMVDVDYLDEVDWHLTRQSGRARQGQRYQWIRPTQRGQILSLVVASGHEGVIAHDVTLGAYNTNKLPCKFLVFNRYDHRGWSYREWILRHTYIWILNGTLLLPVLASYLVDLFANHIFFDFLVIKYGGRQSRFPLLTTVVSMKARTCPKMSVDILICLSIWELQEECNLGRHA